MGGNRFKDLGSAGWMSRIGWMTGCIGMNEWTGKPRKGRGVGGLGG